MAATLQKQSRRISAASKQVSDQEKWIDQCEANDQSYADSELGWKIRQADEEELERLQQRLQEAQNLSPKSFAF